jgi:hypothetical protein
MTTHRPSQADEAHIAVAEYQQGQRTATDRMRKLKAARLAQAAEPPKPKRKKQTPKPLDRPKTSPYRRWRG